MISKETYRDLVLAGSSIVKEFIQSSELVKKCTDQEIDMPAEIFDFMTTSPHICDAFTSLVWVAGEMDFGVEHPHDFLRIMYADTVSLFAFDDPNAERYLELSYELFTTNTVPEELHEIEQKLSPEVRFWVRRNI